MDTLNSKYLNNTYFSDSFKNYPFLAKKRRLYNSLLFLFIFVPFVCLLILRSHYESVHGTNYTLIFNRVLLGMGLAFLILMPIVSSIETKINQMSLCATHHLVYSKCELRKVIDLIEQDKEGKLPIDTNHELYH